MRALALLLVAAAAVPALGAPAEVQLRAVAVGAATSGGSPPPPPPAPVEDPPRPAPPARPEASHPAAADGAADDEGDGEAPGRSKKERLLAEKQARPRVHLRATPERLANPALTLRNVWTREVLAADPARPPSEATLDGFLRDHFTNQATRMDPRLGEVLVRAAARFKTHLIEVVSGYRSAKYNLMLRKKGHAVARESQHPLGHAVDFRLAGVATHTLFRFVRSLRLGGAGYYPHSAFVHADVGRVRTWGGD